MLPLEGSQGENDREQKRRPVCNGTEQLMGEITLGLAGMGRTMAFVWSSFKREEWNDLMLLSDASQCSQGP